MTQPREKPPTPSPACRAGDDDTPRCMRCGGAAEQRKQKWFCTRCGQLVMTCCD